MSEPKEKNKDIRLALEAAGVVHRGHFVYSKPDPAGQGDHGEVYVNKDGIYTKPEFVRDLCEEMADELRPIIAQFPNASVVVGPEKGGIILAQWLAFSLNLLLEAQGSEPCFRAVFAEKKAGGGFFLGRGYDLIVRDRDVIVVEDILNSGGSAKQAVAAVRDAGGNPVALTAIWNRGGVTAGMIGGPHLFSLVDMQFKKYTWQACPMCAEGVPVRTDLGHGQAFLDRMQMRVLDGRNTPLD